MARPRPTPTPTPTPKPLTPAQRAAQSAARSGAGSVRMAEEASKKPLVPTPRPGPDPRQATAGRPDAGQVAGEVARKKPGTVGAAETAGIVAGLAAASAAARNPDLGKIKKRFNCGLHIASFPSPLAVAPNKYTTGTITPVVTQNSPQYKTGWSYRFLFNPEQLSFAARINAELTRDAVFDKMDLFSAQQVFQFTLQIDRQMEVAGYPANGGNGMYDQMSHPDFNEVRRLGCQYDVEYLYKVVNGDPLPPPPASDGKQAYAAGRPSPDVGFLYTTSLFFNFGAALQFSGFISEMRVDHKMFAMGMIPTVSDIVIGVTRTTPYEVPVSGAS